MCRQCSNRGTVGFTNVVYKSLHINTVNYAKFSLNDESLDIWEPDSNLTK